MVDLNDMSSNEFLELPWEVVKPGNAKCLAQSHTVNFQIEF